MWLILQQDKPEDFVIASGITTKVREFIRMAFEVLDITIEFIGEGLHEKGIIVECQNSDYQIPVGNIVVEVDSKYFRPTEVDLLIGNPTKAKTQLGWELQYNLNQLVDEMIWADINLFQQNS
jgi:GDPmannose 4,6-dehydratase